MNNIDLITTGAMPKQGSTAAIPPGLPADRDGFLNELKKVMDSLGRQEQKGKNIPEYPTKPAPKEDSTETENNSHTSAALPAAIMSLAGFAEVMAGQASTGGNTMYKNDKNYTDPTPLVEAIQAELDNGTINKISKDDLPTAEQYITYFEEMLVAAREILSMIRQDGGKDEETGSGSMGLKHITVMPEITSTAAQLVQAENLSQLAEGELPLQYPIESAIAQSLNSQPELFEDIATETARQAQAKESATVDTAKSPVHEMQIREDTRAEKPVFNQTDRQHARNETEQTKQNEVKATETSVTKTAMEQAPKSDAKSAVVKPDTPLPKEAEVVMSHAAPRTAAASTESKGETARNMQINQEQSQTQQQAKVAATDEASSGNNDNSGKNADNGDKPAARSTSAATGISQTTLQQRTSASSFESELKNASHDTDSNAGNRNIGDTLLQRAANNTAHQQEARHIDRTLEWESAKDAVKLARLVQQAGQDGATKLTVRLAPEHLGRLQIQLTEVAGRISAKFLADSAESRNILASHGDTIARQLAEKGITIDNMDFNFHDSLAKQTNTGADGHGTKQPNHRAGQENRQTGSDNGNEDRQKDETAKGLYA